MKINLFEASRQLGKYETYLSMMKNQRPDKFRVIRFMGKGDLVKGHHKFDDYGVDLKRKIDDIIYEHKSINEVAIILRDAGFHHSSCNIWSILNSIYVGSGITTLQQMRTAKKMIRYYEKGISKI